MYTIDDNDRVVALPEWPKPDRYEPFIAHGDVNLCFAYAIAQDVSIPQEIQVPTVLGTERPLVCTMSWKRGWKINPPASQTGGAPLFALVEVSGPGHIYTSYDYAGKYPPFAAHPLRSRGLFPQGVFLVEHSSWLRYLRTMIPEEFPSRRFDRFDSQGQGIHETECVYHHFIFTFAVSTLEFITDRLDCQFVRALASDVQAEVSSTKWLMW